MLSRAPLPASPSGGASGRLRRHLRALLAAALLLAPACAPPESERVAWFAPNLGSPDLLELFTQPQQWAQARGQTGVFQLYERQLLAEACPECGRNALPGFDAAGTFARLAQWNIALAVEAPVLKDHACNPEIYAARALEAIRNLERRGAALRYLAMDEPRLGGDACGLGLEDSARATAAFVRQVRAAFPAVRIGDIEPYPRYGAPALLAWTAALRLEGATPAFFHLDVDRVYAGSITADVAGDLRALRDSLEEQGIPFGVIFWGADGTDDAAYAADVRAWVGTVHDAIGLPSQPVFQSWSVAPDGGRTVPRNLPETGPDTHTRLIDDGLSRLRAQPSPSPR